MAEAVLSTGGEEVLHLLGQSTVTFCQTGRGGLRGEAASPRLNPGEFLEGPHCALCAAEQRKWLRACQPGFPSREGWFSPASERLTPILLISFFLCLL